MTWIQPIDDAPSGLRGLREPGAARRTRCLVCGFTEVTTDEVAWPRTLLRAECPRCEHRWTESPPPPAQTPPVAVVRRVPAHRPEEGPDEEPAVAA